MTRSGRHLAVLVAAAMVLLAAASLGTMSVTAQAAGADETLPPLPGDSTTSSSTAEATTTTTTPSTTTTTAKPATTTTTAPRRATTTTTEYIPAGEPDPSDQDGSVSSSTQDADQATPYGQASTSGESADSPAGTTESPPAMPPPFPGMENYDAPPGPRSTGDIIDMLRSVGASDARIAFVLVPFPVVGPASYSNDWGAPRTTPTPHAHEGCDIFAGRGTPVVAVAQGRVGRLGTGGAGGTSLRLTTSDGMYFYYAHLDSFAPFLYDGTLVAEGEVLGYVGTSGNAEGTAPHLHFEVHVPGGTAVPPLPYLDRWLADARAEARALAGIEETESHEIPVLSAGVDAGAAVVSGAGNVARTVLTRAAAVTVNRGSASAVEPLFGIAVILGLAWLYARRGRTRAVQQLRLQQLVGATRESNQEVP